MGLDVYGMDKVEAFEHEFGTENLGALYDELAMHYPDKENMTSCNGKLIWGLYSILYHNCLKETSVGTLDEYNLQKWTYHCIFYGYIADVVKENAGDISDLFNPNHSEFEDGHYEQEEEEEEEERPVRTGLAKYDYLLKC